MKLLVGWVSSSHGFAFQDLQQLTDVHLTCVIASISLHQQWRVVARWRSSEHCGQDVTVKSIVSSLILVHLDCQMKPGFWVSVGWPSNGNLNASERRQDSMVQSSAELDYNGLRVGVLGITYEVPELI